MKPSVIIDGTEYVSLPEAQRRVGVSRRTIYNWISSGRLTPFRLNGSPTGPLRFKASELKYRAVVEKQ